MAKKLISNRYMMSTYLGDNMLQTDVSLTAKDFNRIKGDLMKQHEQHSSMDNEFYTEYSFKQSESEKMITKLWVFSYGINEIYLRQFTAKQGYGFTSRNTI